MVGSLKDRHEEQGSDTQHPCEGKVLHTWVSTAQEGGGGGDWKQMLGAGS